MSSARRKGKYKGPNLRRTNHDAPVKVKDKNWIQDFCLILVLGLSFFMFLFHMYGANFDRRGGAMTFDESLYTQLGLQIKNGVGYNTQKIYEDQLAKGRKLPAYVNLKIFKHPPVFPTLISSTYFMKEGKSSYEVKELYDFSSLVSNIMGSFLIVLIFLLARKLFDYRLAMAASIILAFDFNIWQCSTRVWMETTWVFFIYLGLWFFLKGVTQSRYFYAAGVALGLGLLTKYPAFLAIPIILSYTVLFHRELFKKREFYMLFIITGFMFMPWVLWHFKVYGADGISQMLYSTHTYKYLINKFLMWGAGFGVVFAGVGMALKKTSAELPAVETVAPLVRKLFGFLIVITLGYFLTRGDFWGAMGSSLSWNGFPDAGWKMGMFDQEPWYFYIKQHIKYSPFYLLMLIGLVRAPFASKSDVFLAITVFWMLSFPTSWGNFQGRYALCFVPAATILIARTAFWIHDSLRKKDSMASQVGYYAFCLVMLYFAVKTVRTDYIHAFVANVAYY